MSSMATYRLGDIVTFINGRAYSMPEMLSTGKYRIVRVGNFTGKDEWYYSDMELSEDKYCQKGDLLYKWACTFGPEIWNEEKVIYHYHIWKVIPHEKYIDKDYLYFLLLFMTSKWLNAAHGSTMIHITKEIMENNIVTIPADVKEQHKIALKLRTLNDKISLNNSICSDLETMVKQLYNYWFVQFDFPDENGKPYKSSGGKMVWNEELKREIPEGWEVKKISSVADLVTISVSPKDDVIYHHYSIPAFDNDKLPTVENGSNIESNKYSVPENCVLVSKLNPQFKRIWFISTPNNNSICSTEFLPIKAKKIGINALYSVLNCDEYSVHLRQKASSSTGSRKRIDPKNCISFKFPYNGAVFTQFDKFASPIFKQIDSFILQNQQLASLRDFLLPMLMNGQLKIKN